MAEGRIQPNQTLNSGRLSPRNRINLLSFQIWSTTDERHKMFSTQCFSKICLESQRISFVGKTTCPSMQRTSGLPSRPKSIGLKVSLWTCANLASYPSWSEVKTFTLQGKWSALSPHQNLLPWGMSGDIVHHNGIVRGVSCEVCEPDALTPVIYDRKLK